LLLPSVSNGLRAVAPAHRAYFDETIRSAFSDSLDIDEAFRANHDKENRWDYLLGHRSSRQVIAAEPHSAKDDEIGTVIRKRKAAREQLRGHLRDGAKITKWLWVASGRVRFADTERARFRLDQNGIEFVGTRVMAKHLPSATAIKNAHAKPVRARGK
jgi:hypothetical protein